MHKDEEFVFQWKFNHEKGILSCLIRFVINYIIILGLSVVVFYFIFPFKRDNLKFVIQLYIINFVIVIITKILDWFNKEKRYRKITDEIKSID
jgi:hypothetical protein